MILAKFIGLNIETMLCAFYGCLFFAVGRKIDLSLMKAATYNSTKGMTGLMVIPP